MLRLWKFERDISRGRKRVDAKSLHNESVVWPPFQHTPSARIVSAVQIVWFVCSLDQKKGFAFGWENFFYAVDISSPHCPSAFWSANFLPFLNDAAPEPDEFFCLSLRSLPPWSLLLRSKKRCILSGEKGTLSLGREELKETIKRKIGIKIEQRRSESRFWRFRCDQEILNLPLPQVLYTGNYNFKKFQSIRGSTLKVYIPTTNRCDRKLTFMNFGKSFSTFFSYHQNERTAIIWKFVQTVEHS